MWANQTSCTISLPPRTGDVDVGTGVHQGLADLTIQFTVHIDPLGVAKAVHQGASALEGQWGWQQVSQRRWETAGTGQSRAPGSPGHCDQTGVDSGW